MPVYIRKKSFKCLAFDIKLKIPVAVQTYVKIAYYMITVFLDITYGFGDSRVKVGVLGLA